MYCRVQQEEGSYAGYQLAYEVKKLLYAFYLTNKYHPTNFVLLVSVYIVLYCCYCLFFVFCFVFFNS